MSKSDSDAAKNSAPIDDDEPDEWCVDLIALSLPFAHSLTHPLTHSLTDEIGSIGTSASSALAAQVRGPSSARRDKTDC